MDNGQPKARCCAGKNRGLSQKPLSPCVRNCCLDERDVCLGCARTLDEILRWSKLSNPERLEIMNQLQARRAMRPISSRA
jgi:predicted Fe-S protein YdhL (DUF1289 family)